MTPCLLLTEETEEEKKDFGTDTANLHEPSDQTRSSLKKNLYLHVDRVEGIAGLTLALI